MWHTIYRGGDKRVSSKIRKRKRLQPMTTKIAPPEISENIWGDEEAYYTVQFYNASGFGAESTYTNILAISQAQAIEKVQMSRNIPAYQVYRLYAFIQATRI